MKFARHLGKKLFLPELFDELDIPDPHKNDGWNFPKVRKSFAVPASWKNLLDFLQNTEESYWQTTNIGRPVFEISCFMEKFVEYYG